MPIAVAWAVRVGEFARFALEPLGRVSRFSETEIEQSGALQQ
jgi:hypothetical protein